VKLCFGRKARDLARYLFCSTRDEQVRAFIQYSVGDPDDLLYGFTLAEDDFGKAESQIPVVIYAGELQVLIRKMR
jgi:hypothetical protein